MSKNRDKASANSERAWYCIEFYDEERNYHGYSVAYQTLHEALDALTVANEMAPPTTAIYYWRQDDKPFPEPPDGYSEGPLAKRRT